MRPTRASTLVVLVVACTLIAWLTVRATFGRLPLLPWTAVPALVILAIAETIVGRGLRARLAGRRTGRPLAPLAVARVAALAKASSAAAAMIGGLALGFLIYVVGMLDKPVPRTDAFAAGATVLAAASLLAAALYLEYSCRVPWHDDDDGSAD